MIIGDNFAKLDERIVDNNEAIVGRWQVLCATCLESIHRRYLIVENVEITTTGARKLLQVLISVGSVTSEDGQHGSGGLNRLYQKGHKLIQVFIRIIEHNKNKFL